MPNKEIGKNLDFTIDSWWIDWWRNEKNHFFCCIVQFGEEKYYLERELINS